MNDDGEADIKKQAVDLLKGLITALENGTVEMKKINRENSLIPETGHNSAISGSNIIQTTLSLTFDFDTGRATD